MGRPKKYPTESARKRAKAARERERYRSRIILGDELVSRWQDVKALHDLGTDDDVATFLFECYEKQRTQITSTPARVHVASAQASCSFDYKTPPRRPTVEKDDVEQTIHLSDVSPIGESDHASKLEDFPEPMELQSLEELNESMESDPLGLQVADTKDTSYHPSDMSIQEYLEELDINKRIYQIEVEDLEEILPEDLIEGSREDGDETVPMDSGIQVITSASEVFKDTTYLGYASCLLSLAKLRLPTVCQRGGCGAAYEVTSQPVGSAVILTWTCIKGHTIHKWSSQPRLTQRGIAAGDFMVATSTLLSGNNFGKISLLFKFLGLKAPTSFFFHQVQSHNCVPVINKFWEDLKGKTLQKYQGQPLILAGDGRNDSPGHSSQYCTYTLMHEANHDIMSLVMVDKRETQLKSPNMEAHGLRKALAFLMEEHQFAISEVVTDAHSQIPPILRELGILHQWDVWHGGKNLGKKLNGVANHKESGDLSFWVKDIVKHFWKASEMANGDADVFKSDIRGILHHVVNEHEWVLGDGVGPAMCRHEPLSTEERDKPWLARETPPHMNLAKVLLDKTWLNNAAEHYKNFSPPVYHARVLLAAIDYQQHKDREYKRDKDNRIMFGRVFNKKSQNWCPVPLRVPKQYGYIKLLQMTIIEARLQDPLPLNRKVVVSAQDPRMIRPTIAAVDPKPVTQLVEEHESRLGDKVWWHQS